MRRRGSHRMSGDYWPVAATFTGAGGVAGTVAFLAMAPDWWDGHLDGWQVLAGVGAAAVGVGWLAASAASTFLEHTVTWRQIRECAFYGGLAGVVSFTALACSGVLPPLWTVGVAGFAALVAGVVTLAGVARADRATVDTVGCRVDGLSFDEITHALRRRP